MLWMCRMNSDFNISCRTKCHVMTQYCKDNGTIALAKKSKFHQKFKHIEHRYTRLSHIEVRRVDSTKNMTDSLTKQLSQPKNRSPF